MRSLIALAAVCVAVAGVSRAQDARLFVLKKTDHGVAIVPIVIPKGQTQVIPCGGDHPYIDIVFPPGPGGSGSIAQASRPAMIVARNVDGQLNVVIKRDGRNRDLQTLEAIGDYDIRVSVISASGKMHAFLISAYDSVVEDPVGPAIDLFAGKIPLGAGDYVICTDTYRRAAGVPAHGEVTFDSDRYLFVRGALPDGGAGDFVLDLGAGQTLVNRAFLPEGTGIERSYMTEYSDAGKRLLKYEPNGATGPVQSVLGHALLPELRFGDIRFANASVAVMPELPDIFGRPVAGILGIDLLRRAEIISLSYPMQSRATGTLRLRDRSKNARHPALEVACSFVNSHVMIPVEVNGKPTSFVIDTGAPSCILDAQAARLAQIDIQGLGRNARGLDEGTASISPATAQQLRLGAREFRDVALHVGPLPVFARMRTHDQCVGLMGNSFFQQLGEMEIDLGQRTVRFHTVNQGSGTSE